MSYNDRPPPGPPPEGPRDGGGAAAKSAALKALIDEAVRAQMVQLVALAQPPRLPSNGDMDPDIVKAVLGIMKRVPDIKKSGENKVDKYKYTTIGDVYATLRDAMLQVGLVMFQRQVGPVQIVNKVAMIQYEYDLAHENGKVAFNVGANTGACRFEFKSGTVDDKAVGKAQTSALKYHCLSFFKIAPDDAVSAALDIEADAQGVNEEPREPDRAFDRPRDDRPRDDRPRDDRPRDDRLRDDRPRNDARALTRPEWGGPPDWGNPPPYEPPFGAPDNPPPGPPGEPPPGGREPPRTAEEQGFRKEVMALKTKLENARSEADAALIWTDHAELLRRMVDTTYEYLRSAYLGVWNVTPPAI